MLSVRKSGPSVNPALPWSRVGAPWARSKLLSLQPQQGGCGSGAGLPCCLAGGEVAMAAGSGLCAIVSLSKDCES